ncbi:hypothetical protein ACRE_033440 [Hapsidospora chrysogenum ATCC 11550]|uniref:BRCT domain-containing protein n=1 Tax=Hapsidospora chrysogenum (strain ATCC 11550 / CBS 779.69 / DSM 880 / IAM 14645 / JCM 23072 / IMI 49137) TaxID=857340 RepID=A0A086T900_HAPC1|nr:hypothetical protein ACRE_033440 [Hapsidospora chrysogenum ATCC 11550]
MGAPPTRPALPAVAKPRFGTVFDPWNSSSSGHQRPEPHAGSAGTGWRESRNRKINSQFRGGASGGQRMSDTWGAGAEGWDAEIGAVVPGEVRRRYQGGRSVLDMLVRPGVMRESLPPPSGMTGSGAGEGENPPPPPPSSVDNEEALMAERRREDEEREAARTNGRGIFDGVVVYVNGSTYPLVSDHKLKHILSENGAQMSLHLGRRKVTHVILGRPAGSGRGAAVEVEGGRGGGAGGGLAGGKLDKEIRRIGGCGIKYVGAECRVLESLSAGKRLPEARFANMSVAPKGQGSVYGLYTKRTTTKETSQ